MMTNKKTKTPKLKRTPASNTEKLSKTTKIAVPATNSSVQQIKNAAIPKKKGLSSGKRLALMMIEGGVISILCLGINFSVLYLGINYTKWTITLGVIAVTTVNAVTYFLFRKKIVSKASRNAIALSNVFALMVNIVISSIYLVFHEEINLAILSTSSQANISPFSISGKLIVDIMTIAKHVPTINAGHIVFVLVLLIYSMMRKALK